MYIPTALSAREDATLRRYAAGRRVAEAGALLGHSTIQLASTARGVVSIDRHTGYDRLPNNTLRSFLRNLDVAGASRRVLPVVGDAQELRAYPADFVFIDLCGTHDGTLAALRAAQAPLIGVHDYQRQSCPGVATAVEASGYRVIERVDSLVILERAQEHFKSDRVLLTACETTGDAK